MIGPSDTIPRPSALPALPAVACATAATALLWPYTERTPLALYYLAVLVAAIYGGSIAGWLAIGLSVVIAHTFFLSSHPVFAIDAASVSALTLFALVGCAVVLLVQQLRMRELATRLHEREVERLSRLYAALSQINQAIVQAHTQQTLFQKVCQVLVNHGGFRMAAIDWRDPESGRLARCASAGDTVSDPYVSVSTSGEARQDTAEPLERVLRSGRAEIFNDVSVQEAPSRLVPKRSRAMAVIPVESEGAVRGLLSVCADEAAYFQDKEIGLLAEAATDLGFGVACIARDVARVAAQAQAEDERRFSETLIEAVPGILYLYDENGRFLRFNHEFEQVSGYSAAEIRELTPLDFFASDDKPLLARKIADVFERGNATVEADFLSKDGSSRPYLFTGRRLELDGRDWLCGMGIDISARKIAEEAFAKSEERYRSTLDNILEGCQLLDFEWRYIYLNAAAETHNRRAARELIGRTMMESWPGIEASPLFASLRRCMEERIAWHEDVEFHFPDGTTGWFDVRGQGTPEGLIVLSIDISARKRAEADRNRLMQLERLAKDDLEQKVVERTTELKSALLRAESADRLKSAFLATMSHELRTPLNSILGFTGIMLQGLPGPLNTEQSKQLGMVNGSAKHLLALINDVLDISKIEAGELDMRDEVFDLPQSIAQVAASVGPFAEEQGLALRLEIAPELGPMCSDRRRVEQILLNVVNNAVKFTERGSVSIRADKFDSASDTPHVPGQLGHGAWVRIQVVDTGIGIGAEDLDSLFKPFRQIDSGLCRQHEGTGLGLAICGRLTALLGGGITVNSELGRGSTFTVRLPLFRSGPEGTPS